MNGAVLVSYVKENKSWRGIYGTKLNQSWILFQVLMNGGIICGIIGTLAYI